VKLAIAKLIGRHVVARRIERGLTQEQVALKAGVSRQAISLIERGLQTPSWPTLYLVAAVLKCEVYDFLPTYKQVATSNHDHS